MANIILELETERLLLRRGRPIIPTDDELRIDHQRYIVEFEDPQFPFEQYKDVILFDYYSATEGNRFGYYTIFPKSGGQWLGHCPLMSRLCSPTEVARFGKAAIDHKPYHGFELEIGWALSIYHRNQGYATEAAQALIKYGFQTLQVARIVAFTECTNHASINVMNRLGMYIDSDVETDSVIGCIENNLL